MGYLYDYLDFLNDGILPNHAITDNPNPVLSFLIQLARKGIGGTGYGEILLWMVDHGIQTPYLVPPLEHPPLPQIHALTSYHNHSGSGYDMSAVRYELNGPGTFSNLGAPLSYTSSYEAWTSVSYENCVDCSIVSQDVCYWSYGNSFAGQTRSFSYQYTWQIGTRTISCSSYQPVTNSTASSPPPSNIPFQFFNVPTYPLSVNTNYSCADSYLSYFDDTGTFVGSSILDARGALYSTSTVVSCSATPPFGDLAVPSTVGDVSYFQVGTDYYFPSLSSTDDPQSSIAFLQSLTLMYLALPGVVTTDSQCQLLFGSAVFPPSWYHVN